MLTIANCQVPGQVMLSGSVAVRNKWGYLDTLDYWKVPVYGCSLVFSAGLAILYLVALARQEGEVRSIQSSCVVLVLLSLLEAGVQCHSLQRENASGLPSWGRFGDGLYLVKSAYGLVLFVAIAQGTGL